MFDSAEIWFSTCSQNLGALPDMDGRLTPLMTMKSSTNQWCHPPLIRGSVPGGDWVCCPCPMVPRVVITSVVYLIEWQPFLPAMLLMFPAIKAYQTGSANLSD